MPQIKDVKVGRAFYLDPNGIGVCKEILVRRRGKKFSARVLQIKGMKNGSLVLARRGRIEYFENPSQSVILFSVG